MTKRLMALLGLIAAATLVLAACGGQQPEAPAEEPAAATEAPAEEPAEEMPAEGAMPGEGVTVNMGRATWDTGWFQAAIFDQLLTDLGYDISDPLTLENAAFYLSAANGDVDFWANGWFPQHDVFINEERVQGNVELVGFEVEAGALQGYLIDKATADAQSITNIEQLKDPEIAAIFDSNGNGKADLIGCNPGWGCELIIEHHLDAYELRDTVEHVQGEYSALMADTIARFGRGEPVLFYTWTPNWTVSRLALGDDIVWIEVPFSSMPEDQGGDRDTSGSSIPGCASDPCDLGFPPNDIRVVANTEFLDNNPAARTLFELVEIPLADIAEQNVLMQEGANSEADIQGHAQQWIEDNRATVDGWLEQARAAAN